MASSKVNDPAKAETVKPLTKFLNELTIRYPGARKESISLKELIKDEENVNFLQSQYPCVNENGHVQFIPEFDSKMTGYKFLKREQLPADLEEKHTSVC